MIIFGTKWKYLIGPKKNGKVYIISNFWKYTTIWKKNQNTLQSSAYNFKY